MARWSYSRNKRGVECKLKFEDKPVRPIQSELLRPMVKPVNMAEFWAYPVTAIDLFDATGNRVWLVNPEFDKTIKTVEAQPPESGAAIVFGRDEVREGNPGISFSRILSVEKVTDYRTPKDLSSLDTFLEIIFVGDGGNQTQLKIGMDISYMEKIMNELQTLMKINTDPSYWKGHSILFPSSTEKLKTINIYPLTPFLADEEEIVWIQSRDNKYKKVIWVNVVTNFRIFQYSYEKHSGSAILIPNLKDVEVANEKKISLPIAGAYSEFAHTMLKTTKSNSAGIFADITFVATDDSRITFKLINDPETMLSLISELKKKYGSAELGAPIEIEEKIRQERQINDIMQQEFKKIQNDKPGSVATSLHCSNCGNSNPIGSKFCNACGQQLLAKCDKCGHLSPQGALYCGQCGLKLVTSNKSSKSDDSLVISSSQDSLSNDFSEYVELENGLKITFPSSWRVFDRHNSPLEIQKLLTHQTMKVALFPKGDASGINSEICLGIFIVEQTAFNLTSEYLVEAEIANFRQSSPNFTLIESSPTTLGGMSAQRLVFTQDGKKYLFYLALKDRREYQLVYVTKPEEYMKFLPVAEQMIRSFKVLN